MTTTILPVKIERICYCCSKCGVVIAYEEQPCPLCAARAIIARMEDSIKRYQEMVLAYEDQWIDEHV